MRGGALQPFLDRLSATYDTRCLASDPPALVHRFPNPADQEVAGLVASSPAYGNVQATQRSVLEAVRRLGILDACPRHRDPRKCGACPLEPVCLL